MSDFPGVYAPTATAEMILLPTEAAASDYAVGVLSSRAALYLALGNTELPNPGAGGAWAEHQIGRRSDGWGRPKKHAKRRMRPAANHEEDGMGPMHKEVKEHPMGLAQVEGREARLGWSPAHKEAAPARVFIIITSDSTRAVLIAITERAPFSPFRIMKNSTRLGQSFPTMKNSTRPEWNYRQMPTPSQETDSGISSGFSTLPLDDVDNLPRTSKKTIHPDQNDVDMEDTGQMEGSQRLEDSTDSQIAKDSQASKDS
ncbi:hypothetical protein BZA05DRAFT_465549 [Tricharina praecox]|nr:uncharacterized protein BZA05DRAFT_465549 [Tricharina praecox]KAI5841239.1 hypothetical protein BZA05DRAFT_465549 [Tricharina praecox]